MSAGYNAPQTRTLAASGSWDFIFSATDEPFTCYQVVKPAGTMDVWFTLSVSNVVGDSIAGYAGTSAGTYAGDNPPSGSQYNGYWAPVAVGRYLLTGSATDGIGSALVIPSGSFACARGVKLNLRSDIGGTVTVYPWRKS